MGPKSKYEIHICLTYTLYTYHEDNFTQYFVLTATHHMRPGVEFFTSVMLALKKVSDFGFLN
jgi:hypothetical protein